MNNRILIWAGKNHAMYFTGHDSRMSGLFLGVRVQYLNAQPFSFFQRVGHPPENFEKIARARRALELGLDVQIPPPEFPPVETTENEFVQAVKVAWEGRWYNPAANNGQGEWEFDTPPRSHVGNGEYLESSLPPSNGEQEYGEKIRSEISKIAPEWVVNLCDRLQAFANENDRAILAGRDTREREELAHEFGIS